jgi:hypothetical protein
MIGYYPINPASGLAEEDTFGPRFFRTQFYEQMREICSIEDRTQVLEIILTSGQVLDVARIVELKSDHMLLEVFIDSRDCDNTYHAYIRYITIYRINVLNAPRAERPIGFSNRAPVAEDEPVKPAPKSKTGAKPKG